MYYIHILYWKLELLTIKNCMRATSNKGFHWLSLRYLNVIWFVSKWANIFYNQNWHFFCIVFPERENFTLVCSTYCWWHILSYSVSLSVLKNWKREILFPLINIIKWMQQMCVVHSIEVLPLFWSGLRLFMQHIWNFNYFLFTWNKYAEK